MSREYVLMATFTAGETFVNPMPEAESNRLGDLYKWVKLNSDGQVVKCSADTDKSIGTVQYCVPAGEPTQVAIGGEALAQVGAAAIVANASVSCDASGRSATAASGDRPMGIQLEASTAAEVGAAVRTLITPHLPLLP